MGRDGVTESTKRRSRRPILFAGALAVACVSVFLTWWTTTLKGLPDVGDPFDVGAFERPIPDDSNAFVLYREAASLLPKEPDIPANYDWEAAGLEQRRWAERSREPLAIWRKGTERPDALDINPASLTIETKLDVAQNLRSFARLALLEGSRLEGSGDFEGALDWYLAVLRSSRHCGRRGVFIERLIGIAMHRWASTRLVRWAAGPKADARMLRLALDAAIAADAATPPTSDGLKAEYVSFLHSSADPELMVRLQDYEVVANNQGGSVTVYGTSRFKASLMRVRRIAMKEPERSRRVVRMIFANWLACCDLPPSRQPSRALSVTSTTPTGPARILLGDLFVVGDEAPATARALPPEKLARWYASTVDAELMLPAFSGTEKAVARERSAQAGLLVALANELHRREHGAYPEDLESLVGPYLKALPEGYRPAK